MDEATREAIADHVATDASVFYDGIYAPFEVVDDADGVHLVLDGEVLASIPSDPDERRAERADLKRRYGIALFEAGELADATPAEIGTWLFYAAGLKDSGAALIDWKTGQFEARLPDMAAVVAEGVRDRLGGPFASFDAPGRALVESLDFAVSRRVDTEPSEWTGEALSRNPRYVLEVHVDLDWVDDGFLVVRLHESRVVDGELVLPRTPFTGDTRADAERMVPPECIEWTADALRVPWTEDATEAAADRVEECLDRYGEAFVAPPSGSGDAPGEAAFRQGMDGVSGLVAVPHEVAVVGTNAYVRRLDA